MNKEKETRKKIEDVKKHIDLDGLHKGDAFCAAVPAGNERHSTGHRPFKHSCTGRGIATGHRPFKHSCTVRGIATGHCPFKLPL
ncbi:MAG: hypothetical protein IJR07_04930 [Bacteroidaceae bacterium]|nr:hypothetical protein [Bacteroidaceae bacterium]